MVFIKKLEMRGFKSFGSRRISLTLQKGFTAITGPNGSGKSNILDSVKFVLGEPSARSLRADRFAEVIFEGTGDVEKAKSAWVSLQFDNSDRRIPIDSDIVTISREVDRNGQSTYRVNTRRSSRSQLMDLITVAGFHLNEFNVVMQGTVTRLADVTPEERRRIVEDLTGIAEYDRKKSEAQTQLSAADVNLKIATSKMDEVQLRTESLFRERNDALRHNRIEAELRDLRGKLLSHEVLLADENLNQLQGQLKTAKEQLDGMRHAQSQLQAKRDGVELELRRFDEEILEKGGSRLVEIQRKIGETNATIASLKTEVSSLSVSGTGLARMKKAAIEQEENLKASMEEATRRLRQLKAERARVQKKFEEDVKLNQEVLERLSQARETLGVSSSRTEEIDEKIGALTKQIVRIDTKIEGSDAKVRVLSENVSILEARKTEFESTLTNLRRHLGELGKVKASEVKALKDSTLTIEQKARRKESSIKELVDAEKTAARARRAIIEFETQRGFADRVASDERALKRIEELGRIGAITGIVGRFERLIRVESRYRNAIEAAAAGWMRSIVVEDFETAIRCVESLKRMKIGRIKLIPLKDIVNVKGIEPPRLDGVLGSAASFIHGNATIQPAINFVFGDTVVVSTQKAGLLASRTGFRAAVVSGDIYEPGGALESGHYRAALDVSSVIPSDAALEDLDETVRSLERMLNLRRREIETLDGEIGGLGVEKVRRTDLIAMLESESKEIGRNIDRIKQNLKILNRRLRALRNLLEREQSASTELEKRGQKFQEDRKNLEEERRILKLKVKPSFLIRLEATQKELESSISEERSILSGVDAEISSLEANTDNTLRPQHHRVQIELATLDRQIGDIEKRRSDAATELEKAEKTLKELRGEEESISMALSKDKSERQRFHSEIDSFRTEIERLSGRINPIDERARSLELKAESENARRSYLMEQLANIGFKEPLKVEPDEISAIKSSISMMEMELQRIGPVNQLSIEQYEQQKENYRQLSIRRNELEQERRSIVTFMEEIEKKKKDTFMGTFTSVADNFKTVFSKLTGGGDGLLRLESTEDPFSGGLDIFVQFPGKSSRLVSSTSGGEKSVAAVAFIFAIQSLLPAQFYFFDEIDAHLDPANAERLADLLKQQATNSQMVVITLRDVLVDRASLVYGVYLERGLSRIVSIGSFVEAA